MSTNMHKNKKLHDKLEALERRFKAIEEDPIIRMLTANSKAMVRKANTMRDRYIAAAKEKDPFWRAAKKPIVFREELR
jgi:hypothetical protein